MTATYAEAEGVALGEVAYGTPRNLMEVRHGYTLRDLDQMTRAAVIADRSMASDIQDRKDTAWSAIAEHLCASEESPTRQELIQIGWQAIYREARTTYRSHGRPDEAWGSDHYASAPRFAQYWAERQIVPSPEGRIVERLAVAQVIAPLGAVYRDALIALAVTDNYMKAADLLGINYPAFTERLRVARRRVLGLWHEGETPYLSRHRTDRRTGSHTAELATHCSAGHEWTPENTRVRHRILRGKRHTSRVCKACEQERSVRRVRDRAAKKAATGEVTA